MKAFIKIGYHEPTKSLKAMIKSKDKDVFIKSKDKDVFICYQPVQRGRFAMPPSLSSIHLYMKDSLPIEWFTGYNS